MKTIPLIAAAATFAAGIGAAQAQGYAPQDARPADPVAAVVGTTGNVVSGVTGGVLETGRSVGFGTYDGSLDSNGLRPFINGVF